MTRQRPTGTGAGRPFAAGLAAILFSGIVLAGPPAGGAEGPARRAGAERRVGILPGVDMILRWIPPTTGAEWRAMGGDPDGFLMGTPEEEIGHDWTARAAAVTPVPEGFWMGQFEVTQAQWEAVMGYNPSFFRDAGPTAPVERVSWNDAQVFIRKLNEESARRSAERPDAPRLVFRLPTEVEWEYACRAGTVTPFHAGKTLDATQANFDDGRPRESEPQGGITGGPMRVGSYPPNAWGLHDMHGNVWEWCEDIFIRHLLDGTLENPPDLPAGIPRMVRGGSWFGSARLCRSDYRANRQKPDLRAINIGFRLVMREVPVGGSDRPAEAPASEEAVP